MATATRPEPAAPEAPTPEKKPQSALLFVFLTLFLPLGLVIALAALT